MALETPALKPRMPPAWLGLASDTSTHSEEPPSSGAGTCSTVSFLPFLLVLNLRGLNSITAATAEVERAKSEPRWRGGAAPSGTGGCSRVAGGGPGLFSPLATGGKAGRLLAPCSC